MKFSEKLPGEKVDGALWVMAYLKPLRPGEGKIDVSKANFRIRMPDGSSLPMRCEVLPEKAEEAKSEGDKKKIAAGFTHKLWIPKDPAKYAGAVMLNDLPKDFLDIQMPMPPREIPAS